VLIRYVPNFFGTARSKHFYLIKHSVKYFSEYLADFSPLMKVLILFSQIIFIFIIGALTSLIHQRISVPELTKEKTKNYIILLSSLVSATSVIGMTFFKHQTLAFTKNYFGLADNILFLLFLLSSTIICGFSFILLNNIMSHGIIFNHSKYLRMKKVILILMSINIALYFSCLILISYYHPIIAIEKFFTSVMVVLKEINSIMFILNYIFFIFSLKHDLQHIQMNLEVRPDIEFFVDPEEDYTL